MHRHANQLVFRRQYPGILILIILIIVLTVTVVFKGLLMLNIVTYWKKVQVDRAETCWVTKKYLITVLILIITS